MDLREMTKAQLVNKALKMLKKLNGKSCDDVMRGVLESYSFEEIVKYIEDFGNLKEVS